MSDTPRTDKYGGYCAEYHKVDGMTLIEHARNLERENAELRAEVERLKLKIFEDFLDEAMNQPTQ